MKPLLGGVRAEMEGFAGGASSGRRMGDSGSHTGRGGVAARGGACLC